VTGELGLYLHIPFCRSKCVYCDFPSYPGMLDYEDTVIDRMIGELEERSARLGRPPVSTVYIGGGTPSILRPALFLRLLKAADRCFPFLPGAEVSVEANPGTLEAAFIDAALEGGVNRVSLGVQSANERLLRLLGRIHRFRDAERAVLMLRAAGIHNVNLDMMLGLPGQTTDDVRDTLKKLLSLSPVHMSCYGLIPEEGTPLYEHLRDGTWTLPDEDTERDMYELCRSTLASNGFGQYEISNFALPGMRCRHNLNCWNRCEYVGVGVSAAGFIGRTRYKNPSTIPGYLKGEAPEITVLTPEDERFESVMLGLRLTDGLSDADFTARHGMTLRDAFGDRLDGPIGSGLLTFDNGQLKLTRRGMDLQNTVLVQLL